MVFCEGAGVAVPAQLRHARERGDHVADGKCRGHCASIALSRDKPQIGHNIAKSQTFRPEIVHSEELNCFFVDVAGFMDTNGKFFDLLNSFVIKYLFLNAKSVKFITTFTFEEISHCRGSAIRDMVEQLQ